MPEDKLYELIDGDLYTVPAPSPYHQEIAGRIEFELRRYILETGAGVLSAARRFIARVKRI
ncbi:Uma2 family endonuclease [Acidobacteria bacterium AH-259-A15]|nr:Uma2 family endonuclease [Acidobacteria bacterium AH-259-A15]